MAVTGGEERAYCIIKFHTTRSVIIIQRHFRTRFNKQAPSEKNRYVSDIQNLQLNVSVRKNPLDASLSPMKQSSA